MKRAPLAWLIVAAATVGGLFLWTRARLANSTSPEKPALVVIESSTSHLVTPEMAAASRAMLDRSAPAFAKPATDGTTHRLDAMLSNGPVVLIFIKKGCPCSEAAQAFFNELQTAYPKVSIRGVIDQDSDQAKAWAERFHVAYPILVDPQGELVRSYEIENSAYVVVINPQGVIENHWPGYSRSMLQELGAWMARTSESPERPLHLADAPEDLYTGCPYEL